MNAATQAKGSRGHVPCRWSIRLAGTGIVLIVIAFVSARLSLLGPFPAMLGMTLGTLALILGGILAALGLIYTRGTGGESSVGLVWIALIAGIILLINTGVYFGAARNAAPIHDISTDTVTPPEFDAVIELRGPEANPPEYSGPEAAEKQKAAYPDIQTIVLPDPREFVFDTALSVAEDMGWEIVASSAETGRIEATATTSWVGFKDDVVIRIRSEGPQTLVDVRSKSRIGRGDVGVNARRVRDFRDRLVAAAEPD